MIRELGSGHFGAVYLGVGEVPARGRQPGRRRLVAIKKLKDSADGEAIDALVQEFALLDQVKHRGIVRVFDYIEDENAVVMEYIHGVNLRRVLEELERAHEQVFTEAAVEIGCEIADALYQAWTTPGDNGEPLQLVHRDLKPANIMLTATGEVKVLDWGLARVDNADFRQESADRMRGTLLYMSPEQARMHEVDHRSDIYALGLILYELLMNRPAFRIPDAGGRDGVRQVLAAVEAGDVREACGELEARLPAVGPILTRSLQARPDDRYQNGQDFLVDLRRQLYRDRGSYLQEFCEFFFGTICDIGDPPSIESVAATGRAGRSARNRDLEARLRESMAREAHGSAAADAVTGRATPGRAGGGRVSSGRSAPGCPGIGASSGGGPASSPAGRTPGAGRPPATPAAPAASGPSIPSQGAPMPPSSGGGPKRPPVGGGASRATPFAPGGGTNSPKRKIKTMGQRRPDETGMLEMVPLSQNDDEVEAAGDPSATAFFAIPAPKAERARPAAPGMGGGGIGAMGAGPPPPAGPIGAMPPPPPVGGMGGPPPPMGARPPLGQPPPAATQGPVAMAGMGGPPPPAQPAIQGPIASYGGNPQAGASPFQVGAPQGAAGPPQQKDRVRSQVVWVVLFGALLFIGAASVLAIYLVRANQGTEEVVADARDGRRPAAVSAAPAQTKGNPSLAEDDGAADTGMARKKPRGRTRKANPAPSRGSGGGTSAPAPAPKAPSGPAGVTLTMNGVTATAVEINCPGGTRKKVGISGGKAVFAGIPQEDCTIFTKGGQPGKFGPVRGGANLTCTQSGTNLSCH